MCFIYLFHFPSTLPLGMAKLLCIYFHSIVWFFWFSRTFCLRENFMSFTSGYFSVILLALPFFHSKYYLPAIHFTITLKNWTIAKARQLFYDAVRYTRDSDVTI